MATKLTRSQRRKRRQAIIQAAKEPQPSDVVFAACEVTIEASEGSAPQVDVVAYTGDQLSLPNFPHPAVINLAGVKAMDAGQLPFLRDHVQAKAVGHGKPEVQKKQLRHAGKLSIEGEERDKITAASREGFRWQASVGGRIPDIRKHVQTIAAGDRVKVNGRTFTGPVSVINAFLWKETSFVAVGADEGRASASVAAAAPPRRLPPMNEFEKWLQASGVSAEDLSDEQLANLKAAWEATQQSDGGNASVVTDTDVEKIVASATAAAVQAARDASARDRRIDQLFASYSDTSLSDEEITKLREDVEAGNVTEDKAHLQLLQASRSVGGTSNVHAAVNVTRGEHFAMDLEASVGLTAGLSDKQVTEVLVEAGATQEEAEAACGRAARKPRGLKSLILAVCRQAGEQFDECNDDAIRCAMRYSAEVQAAASGFSTVALSGILSRLANKAMLAAYAEADNGGVILRIASTTSTSDFKKFTRYRMTEAGVMTKVPGSGEIEHGTLMEEQYENQVETYGKIISLTRQMIRNDDLDAFLQVPRMLGRMGRHALEQIGITMLVDAPTAADAGTTEFFHGAARGNQEPNYFEGATTNLSLDSLQVAYELFLNQVDADGKPIMIDPAILLVCNADIVTARKLFTDTQYRFTGADTTELINNQWQGMFRPEKSSYLHRLGATPSATQWYLLSEPTTDVAALQVAFLDGQQTPIIQSSETSFNTLGMQMRGYFDFGFALQDPRAIVKSKGAA